MWNTTGTFLGGKNKPYGENLKQNLRNYNPCFIAMATNLLCRGREMGKKIVADAPRGPFLLYWNDVTCIFKPSSRQDLKTSVSPKNARGRLVQSEGQKDRNLARSWPISRFPLLYSANQKRQSNSRGIWLRVYNYNCLPGTRLPATDVYRSVR